MQLNYFSEILLESYSSYPTPIRPYLLKAETHPEFRKIFTKSGMSVFIDILGRAPIYDKTRCIKIRIDNIAKQVERSKKTVQRVLSLLLEKKWLMPSTNHDGRNQSGRFSYREFLIGDELREILGLPVDDHFEEGLKTEDSTGLSTENVDNLTTATKMSSGVYIDNFFLKEASFKNDASLKKPEPQKDNPNGKTLHLPDTLTPLQTELGIHPLGILKLMNLAKTMHQRLQDVWQAKRDQLLSSGATGGRAFHYLKFLLETGEDFAYRARNADIKKSASTPKTHSTSTSASGSVTDYRRYWNKRFVGENGLQVRLHGDGSAAVTNATETNAYVRPADVAPIYEAIGDGRLWLLEE